MSENTEKRKKRPDAKGKLEGDLRQAITGALLIADSFPNLRDPVFKLVNTCINKDNLKTYLKKRKDREKEDEVRKAKPPTVMSKEEYMDIHSRAWDDADAPTLEYLKRNAEWFRDHTIKQPKGEAEGQEVKS